MLGGGLPDGDSEGEGSIRRVVPPGGACKLAKMYVSQGSGLRYGLCRVLRGVMSHEQVVLGRRGSRCSPPQ
jgi:hypothetical protein